MTCNTVIFYDIENLIGLFSSKTNTVLHLEEIYRRVLGMEGVTGVSIQRAYADWGLPIHRNLRDSVLQVGIEPVHIFNTNLNDKVKNAADVSLIIDAVDLAARRPEMENFVIASGDGIFAFLAKKLHEHGKRVIGCGFEVITNIIFRNACDFFIALEKNDTSIVATATKRQTKAAVIKGATPIDDPTQETVKPKPHHKFAKTKYSEALMLAKIDKLRDAGDTSGCMHKVRELVEAVFVESTKDMPGLEISVFVTYINHYIPGFKVRQHGFKRIGEFMRFVLSGSLYCTYSMIDNVLLMAPREAAKATGGHIIEDVDGLLITLPDGSRYNAVFNVPVGEPFIYSIPAAPLPLPRKKTKAQKAAEKAARKIEKEPLPPAALEIVVDEKFIRKWIKSQFEDLSKADALTLSEAKRLATPEYSLETFGIRNPVFREIETKSNLTEQRTVNGKVKYWKEPFKFNGRSYIVYKEWVVGLHKDRFVTWLTANMPKNNK